MGSIGEAAAALGDLVAATAQLPPNKRPAALAALARKNVHAPVLQATSGGDELPERELAELAAAVRAGIPVEIDSSLEPRVRVFIALLRRDALPPAWTLAQDNGSGTVRQQVAFSTSSGAARTSVRLPLQTLVEDERVYAWLPGFRDPRWSVPDDVYDITESVRLKGELERVGVVDGALLLAGSAYLTQLSARADDAVAVLLTGPDGAQVQTPGRRLRRPDLVKGTGPELTRLAWSGWNAHVDLSSVGDGDWGVRLELRRDQVSRVAAVGEQRGPLADPRLLRTPHEFGARVLRLDSAAPGGLIVRIRPLGRRARALPRPVRQAARAIVSRG